MGKRFSDTTAVRMGTATQKCGLLLIALVLQVVFHPFLELWEGGRVVAALAFVSVPVLGVYALSGQRRHCIIASALAILTIVAVLLYIGAIGEDRNSMAPWVAALGALFLIYVGLAFLAFVMRENVDNRARLLAALCVYLLMGLTWAMIFRVIHLVEPDAFGTPLAANEVVPFTHYLYFSFVTLTTLGYGDISPVGEFARTAAVLEAMMGTLYVAIMIAYLVGTYRSDPQVEDDSEETRPQRRRTGEY